MAEDRSLDVKFGPEAEQVLRQIAARQGSASPTKRPVVPRQEDRHPFDEWEGELAPALYDLALAGVSPALRVPLFHGGHIRYPTERGRLVPLPLTATKPPAAERHYEAWDTTEDASGDDWDLIVRAIRLALPNLGGSDRTWLRDFLAEPLPDGGFLSHDGLPRWRQVRGMQVDAAQPRQDEAAPWPPGAPVPRGVRARAREVLAAVAFDIGELPLVPDGASWNPRNPPSVSGLIGAQDFEQHQRYWAGQAGVLSRTRPGQAETHRRAGRRLLGRLGAWPWTHVADGKLPRGWLSAPQFTRPLEAWHAQAHEAAETSGRALQRIRTIS